MTTKQVSVSELSKGSYCMVDGSPSRVTDVQTSRPGKHGHAKIKLTAVGILDDKKRVLVMPGHDNIEVPIIDKKLAQVLSVSGDHANVMDSESFETFDLKIPDDLKETVKDGVNVQYWGILGDKIMKAVKSE